MPTDYQHQCMIRSVSRVISLTCNQYQSLILITNDIFFSSNIHNIINNKIIMFRHVLPFKHLYIKYLNISYTKIYCCFIEG